MSITYDFNLAQQIYALCFASNAIGECTGSESVLQAKLVAALQQELPAISGGWEIAWGPRVYLPANADHPQNVWFAAVSETQKTVVVAVAGTAVLSRLDWLNDFDVDKIVDFATWTNSWNLTDGVSKPPVNTALP